MKCLESVISGDGSGTLGVWGPRPEGRPLECCSSLGGNETEEAEHVERQEENQI